MATMSRIGKISMLPGPVGGLLLMAEAGIAVSPDVVSPSASTPATVVRERPRVQLRGGGPPSVLEAAPSARASFSPGLLALMLVSLARCGGGDGRGRRPPASWHHLPRAS